MRLRSMFVLTLILTCCLSINAGKARSQELAREVLSALDLAGSNRGELEKVIEYYSSPVDSPKRAAALFLIANMEGHSYITYELRDTVGTPIEFNILDYPNLDSLESAFRALEKIHGALDFKEKSKAEDLQTIKADFLINQIDFAFRAWRERPWARKLSFDQFLEYVLPYRGSNEPLESWREVFWTKYGDLPGKMADSTDPIEAASLINDDVKSWFTFNSRYYYHPTDQGLSEMLEHHMGRCEDMTNLAIFAMRATGLAVTSDYTPYWANSGNNHAWNAIVMPDGRVIPFMGAESNPGKYGLPNKVAKVYRKTFGNQHENLAFQPRKQEEMPRYLSGKSYRDVTSAYSPVCDVKRVLDVPAPDTVDIAYICVFNSGEWQPIHWSRIENNAVRFTDMGMDIAYIVGFYEGDKIIPQGNPFILHSDSTIEELAADEGKSESIELTSTTRRSQEISTDGIAKSFLSEGTEYTLSYWKNGWQELGKAVAGDNPLEFADVPSNALYWLVDDGPDHEERIFTIENGRQVWR